MNKAKKRVTSRQPASPHTFTPACVGLIMDGNRRWAKARGLSREQGHLRGYERIKKFVTWAHQFGVKHLVVYGLSTENWKRSPEEVSHLLTLLRKLVSEGVGRMPHVGAVHCIGERYMFPIDLQRAIKKMEQRRRGYSGLTLWLALSYGGRAEIVAAINKLLHSARTVHKKITEEDVRAALYTADMPDPDLIIRTSGEMRLSNFLTWQSAYSELFFTPTYWPDFSKKEFAGILKAYAKRQRRFGA